MAVGLPIALILGAAACSKSNDAPSTDDGGVVTLDYQSWRLADPGAIGELHNGWVDDFNSTQTGISVVGEEVPFEQKNDLLLNQILAGSPPDVVAVQTADIPGLAQYLLPLDDYYEAAGADYADDFIAGSLDLVSWEDTTYGVPVELGPVDGLYYNTEVLDRAGVDPEQAVTSWDAFAEALTAIEALGDTEGWIMAGADASRVGYMLSWFAGAGAPLRTEDEVRENLCSPEGVETFRFLTESFSTSDLGPSPVDIGFDEYLAGFAAGNAGFAQGGAWMHDLFVGANPDLEGAIGVTHLPPAEEGGEFAVTLDAVGLVIPKDSDNPDAAWEFIQHISSAEAQLEEALLTGFLPTLASVASAPELGEQERLAYFAGISASNGQPMMRTTHLAEIRQEIWEEWQAALLGQTDPETAIQNACEAIDGVLE